MKKEQSATLILLYEANKATSQLLLDLALIGKKLGSSTDIGNLETAKEVCLINEHLPKILQEVYEYTEWFYESLKKHFGACYISGE